ncbi:MAG: hypothetical protein WC044_07505 [Crocinitomicaceae bacterium]
MKMKSSKTKIFTALSLTCLLIPLSLLALWIHVFEKSTIQTERIEYFNAYLPRFLENPKVATVVCILFCLLAITFSTIGLKSRNLFGWIIQLFITALSILLLCWFGFTLL